MSLLNVYDGNVFLAVGSARKFNGEKANWYGFPTGGMYSLLGPLTKNRYDSNIVVFDSRSKRKDLNPTYKANRERNPDIIAQSVVLEQLLPKCGYKVVKREGYEGDDLIYKIVLDNYKHFSKINIYSVDMDIATNIDGAGKVELHSPTKQSHNVYRHNYEHVTVKDRVIPFNTILPYKVFFGDLSDNIRKIGREADQYFDSFVKLCEETPQLKNTEFWGTKPAMKYWLVKNKENLSPETIKEISMRMMLIYPMEIQEDFTYDERFNHEAFLDLLNLFGMKTYRKILGTPFRDLTQNEIDYVRRKASEYKAGLVSVDEDLPMKDFSLQRLKTDLVKNGESFDESLLKDNSVYTGDNVGSF